MLAAVVPARNEAKTLARVLETLLALPVDLVMPVLNGCTDHSPAVIRQFAGRPVHPLTFDLPLGIDVPRAAGAARAYVLGAEHVLFVDGDMGGKIAAPLRDLLTTAKTGTDLVLTNCYPPGAQAGRSPLADYLLDVRLTLNRALGLAPAIGTASPSHGPHVVSRALLAQIPWRELAIPPVTLALAARRGLQVRVGATIPHAQLGSPQKDPVHCRRIAETIIGDCLEALQAYRAQPRRRQQNGTVYLGYHPERRFDLLAGFLQTL